VPSITAPVRVRPGGNAPLEMDHVNGAVTPGLACSVCVGYVVATVPFGNVLGVITGRTVRERLLVADCDGLLLSTARTVNVDWPASVGVPEIVPVELRVRPCGRAPATMLQLLGSVPPVVSKDWGE